MITHLARHPENWNNETGITMVVVFSGKDTEWLETDDDARQAADRLSAPFDDLMGMSGQWFQAHTEVRRSRTRVLVIAKACPICGGDDERHYGMCPNS